MIRSITTARAIILPLLLAVLMAPGAALARSAIPAADPNDVNKGVVELETAGSAGLPYRPTGPVGAIADQRAPQQRLGGRIDHTQHVLLQGLQRGGVGRLGEPIRAPALFNTCTNWA